MSLLTIRSNKLVSMSLSVSNQSGVYEQPYGSNGIYNKYFDPYFRDDTNDLDPYFIFLVRDPRGLMNSRLSIARVQYHEKDEKTFHEIASKVEGKKFWRNSIWKVEHQTLRISLKFLLKSLN